jgi:hypothetical protein
MYYQLHLLPDHAIELPVETCNQFKDVCLLNCKLHDPLLESLISFSKHDLIYLISLLAPI